MTLRLSEDLGLDSLTMMEIVMLAEEALCITVSNEELTRLHTLGDVHRFIAAKVADPRSTAPALSAVTEREAWNLSVVGEQVRRIEAKAAGVNPGRD